MAKRALRNVRAQIHRRLREGRGQGTGADFKPYLTIRDVPSLGRRHRQVDLSGGRTMHLLSDHEYHVVALVNWLLPLRDIQEQYPLPLADTCTIAATCGYTHPRLLDASRTWVDVPVTTDLVLTSAGVTDATGSTRMACAVKETRELGSPSVLEKLDIERHYWQQCGVLWVLITERDISVPFAKNVLKLASYRTITDRVRLTEGELADLIEVLTQTVTAADGREPLSRIALACDQRLGFSPGTALAVAYHLLATRRWHTDLQQLLDGFQSVRLLPSPMPGPMPAPPGGVLADFETMDAMDAMGVRGATSLGTAGP